MLRGRRAEREHFTARRVWWVAEVAQQCAAVHESGGSASEEPSTTPRTQPHADNRGAARHDVVGAGRLRPHEVRQSAVYGQQVEAAVRQRRLYSEGTASWELAPPEIEDEICERGRWG